MEAFPILLLGILAAFALFGCMLNSVARAISVDGFVRYAHLATVFGVLAVMAAVSFEHPLGSIVAGGLLLVAAGSACVFEIGWHRLAPGFLALFGGLMTSGFFAGLA